MLGDVLWQRAVSNNGLKTEEWVRGHTLAAGILKSHRCREALAAKAWPVQKPRTLFPFCERLLRLRNRWILGLRAVSELTHFETIAD